MSTKSSVIVMLGALAACATSANAPVADDASTTADVDASPYDSSSTPPDSPPDVVLCNAPCATAEDCSTACGKPVSGTICCNSFSGTCYLAASTTCVASYDSGPNAPTDAASGDSSEGDARDASVPCPLQACSEGQTCCVVDNELKCVNGECPDGG